MRVGRYELASVVDTRFALDGGAMFGVVPRPLWERKLAPDARNRIPLAARCLVAVDRDARRVVLVDAGHGRQLGREARRAARARPVGGGLDAGLARLGVARDDVTDVLLTHLHSDHAGGVARRAAGRAARAHLPARDPPRAAARLAVAARAVREGRGELPRGGLRAPAALQPAPPRRGGRGAPPRRRAHHLRGAHRRAAAPALPRRRRATSPSAATSSRRTPTCARAG